MFLIKTEWVTATDRSQHINLVAMND